MKYGWQIDDIKKKLSEEENNDSVIAQYKKDVYTEMLEDHSTSIKEEVFRLTPNHFIQAIKDFKFNVDENVNVSYAFYFGGVFSDDEFVLPDVDLPMYPIEKVVEKAKSFIRRNDNSSYYFIRKLFDRKSRIHMTQVCPFSTFLGKSYILEKNDHYILINSVNGVQDVVTLLHEATHIEENKKSANDISKPFKELGPLTREHYLFDFMEKFEDPEEVNNARINSLYHYLGRAIRLYETVTLVNNIKANNSVHYIKNNFDTFSQNLDVQSVYEFITSDIDAEVDYILSLIASLDIYLNSSPSDSHFFMSMYQTQMASINSKTLDTVTSYLVDTMYKTPHYICKEKY